MKQMHNNLQRLCSAANGALQIGLLVLFFYYYRYCCS